MLKSMCYVMYDILNLCSCVKWLISSLLLQEIVVFISYYRNSNLSLINPCQHLSGSFLNFLTDLVYDTQFSGMIYNKKHPNLLIIDLLLVLEWA